jgi:peptide/nickel transport system ATP-binding protein
MGKAAIVVDRLHIGLHGSASDIVNDVSFSIAPGEVLGLVGESGSGKTTVGLALLGHARRGAEIKGGSVRIGDIEVLQLDPAERARLRGRVISYVPQDPASALNPALRIGTQLREVLETHSFGKNAEERRARVAEMMREVALPDTARFLRNYPHELSGGQQQRIGLAIAFACRPRVIVLDEPTTGLDVTTQAHVLGTVRELAAAHGVAALYVSHDLAVVGTLATRVAVMYAGRIIELGPSFEMFQASSHPYTQRLIVAIPHLTGGRELVGIAGHAPSPVRLRLRATLYLCHCPVPRGDAGAAADRRRPRRPLHQGGRGPGAGADAGRRDSTQRLGQRRRAGAGAAGRQCRIPAPDRAA